MLTTLAVLAFTASFGLLTAFGSSTASADPYDLLNPPLSQLDENYLNKLAEKGFTPQALTPRGYDPAMTAVKLVIEGRGVIQALNQNPTDSGVELEFYSLNASYSESGKANLISAAIISAAVQAYQPSLMPVLKHYLQPLERNR